MKQVFRKLEASQIDRRMHGCPGLRPLVCGQFGCLGLEVISKLMVGRRAANNLSTQSPDICQQTLSSSQQLNFEKA